MEFTEPKIIFQIVAIALGSWLWTLSYFFLRLHLEWKKPPVPETGTEWNSLGDNDYEDEMVLSGEPQFYHSKARTFHSILS